MGNILNSLTINVLALSPVIAGLIVALSIIILVLLVYIIYLLITRLKNVNEDNNEVDVNDTNDTKVDDGTEHVETLKEEKIEVKEEVIKETKPVVVKEEVEEGIEDKAVQETVTLEKKVKEPTILPSINNEEETTRLNYSLEAHIILAPEESLLRYLEIKNHILSYPDVKISNSWKFERFKYGARTLTKLTLQGKTIRIYFDIDPKELEDTVYNIKDEGSKSNHELTPSMLVVKGNRGVKHAKEIIDYYFKKLDVINEEPKEVILPNFNKTKEDLIEEGLIKVKKVKDTF